MTARRLVTVGIAVVVAVLLAAAGVSAVGGSGGYEATFVFPHATNLFAGSRVQVDGFNVGKVDGLEVRDGKALVKVTVDDKHAPLREGTTARIDWQSLPGERIVRIEPGPETNAALPDGTMITATTPRVELDQILSAFDPETRAALRRLVPGLDAALAGHEEDLGATLEAAGPALHAATDVLEAIGSDGPALQTLLSSLRDLAERLVARRDSVRGVIDGFDRNLAQTAKRAEDLAAGLDELPATLRATDSVLGKVPPAAAAAVPLLRDLLPAVEALPAAAADLRPFLAELRPALAELRPALVSLAAVLDETPSLLDKAHTVVPPVTGVIASLLPILDHLRPYTPELAGALANLNSASANYDANGHFLRIYVSSGSLLLGSMTGQLNPAITRNPNRPPGELEGQPLTDATGSAVR
ncbi:MAG TPA: MlaD family protein [Acidimicrobiia bacterium]|nr:MlaD family protein [Acidimicrobiia bacterium]